MGNIERDPKVPVASEASKRAARDSGLEVRWHALNGELVPFVPLAATRGAVEALEQIVRHADMPAGESWPRAYSEVTKMARSALDRLGGQ